MINLYKAIRFAILWGLVAVLLYLINRFIFTPLLGTFLGPTGLSLEMYAVMMAGVHFGARSGFRGWLVSIVGGGLAGLVAAIFIIIITTVLGGPFNMSASLVVLATAFIVGMFGGFGGEFIDRN